MRIVLSISDASYVMTGNATEEEKGKWHEGWLTAERDKATGNVMVYEKTGKVMLWAGEAGDRSWFWGALKRGGHRKVAERLVKSLKKQIR